MQDEVWKDIPGYEGLYQVSNLGRVKSLPRKGTRSSDIYMLKIQKYKTGYLYVSLSKNNKRKKEKIHRLVALAFISNIKNDKYINHKDENPMNNCVENLEWCTQSYNNKYSKGKQVNQYDDEGNIIKTWSSVREVAETMKFNRKNFTIMLKKGNKNWRYVDDTNE